MDSAQHALIVALKSIRDQADSVLKNIEQSTQQKSLAWKCTACGHTKHFTRPALAEVAAPCPRCGGAAFDPV
jgi:rubrerythrin